MNHISHSSQTEELNEGVCAIIYHARKTLEAVGEADHQKIKLHLAAIRVACEDSRKLLGE